MIWVSVPRRPERREPTVRSFILFTVAIICAFLFFFFLRQYNDSSLSAIQAKVAVTGVLKAVVALYARQNFTVLQVMGPHHFQSRVMRCKIEEQVRSTHAYAHLHIFFCVSEQ